jgi:hypothetical protein
MLEANSRCAACSLGFHSVYVDSVGNDSQFQSIFAAMWWCLPTLLTIGYGDVVPITPIGKLIAAVTSFIGVVVRTASVCDCVQPSPVDPLVPSTHTHLRMLT